MTAALPLARIAQLGRSFSSKRPFLSCDATSVRCSPRISVRNALPVHDRAGTSHRLQLVAEFLGDRAGIDAVSNQLRPDEDDDLGSRPAVVGGAEQAAQTPDVAQPRYSVPRVPRAVADQAAEQYGLPAHCRDRRMNAPLRDRRRQRLLRVVGNARNLLIDLQLDA